MTTDAALIAIKRPLAPRRFDDRVEGAERMHRPRPAPEQRLAGVAHGLRRLRGALAPAPGSPLDRVLTELSAQTERAHAEIDGGQQVAAAGCFARPAASPLAALTEREREILGLMADGHSNSAMCKALHLSPKTVETHVRNIFNKLDLPPTDSHHRRVLAVLAYIRG